MSYTTQHGTVLIIFPPILQTITTAQIKSTVWEGRWLQVDDNGVDVLTGSSSERLLATPLSVAVVGFSAVDNTSSTVDSPASIRPLANSPVLITPSRFRPSQDLPSESPSDLALKQDIDIKMAVVCYSWRPLKLAADSYSKSPK